MIASRVALAGVSSLALAAFTPLPTLAAPTITRLASFTGPGEGNGAFPGEMLTPSGLGTFYGTALQGGADGFGTIFEFNPNGGTITRLASFTGGGFTGGDANGNGRDPMGPLTPSGNGTTFYGTASSGGANGYGTIFEFNRSSGITLKASFTATGTGQNPIGALTPSGNGTTFYGTTSGGGPNDLGTIFEFNPVDGTITPRVSFGSEISLPAVPASGLTPSGNGTSFYGTSYHGGDYDLGTIFEFNPSGGNIITVKASFTGAGPGGNGSYVWAPLIPSGNGTSFYGTASYGGVYDLGTIFEFNPTTGITLKASFTGSGTGNGSVPYAALTPSGNGTTFYGTAQVGGANDLGTIFEFDPSGGTITRLASFTGDGTGNGSIPVAPLTPSGTGTFYSTAALGGANDFGTIFEFNPAPPVPGPLPLLGAGAAFGWSRQLRRRVRRQQPRLRVLA